MMRGSSGCLQKGQRWGHADKISNQLPAQNLNSRVEHRCQPSRSSRFSHGFLRHCKSPRHCVGNQRVAAAECDACNASLVPSAEQSGFHTRLRYVLKAAGLVAALYAWFQYSKARPGSLFASTLSAPAGHHGNALDDTEA